MTVIHRLFVSIALVLGASLVGTPSFGAGAGAAPRTLSVPHPVERVVEVSDASRFERILAISDVHGMIEPLSRLLQASKVIDASGQWVAGRTLLVVVGDSIDKGPDSLPVIDLWMRLQNQAPGAGGRLLHLLGNHEAEFLASPTREKSSLLRDELLRRGLTLADLTDPARPRGAFLRSLPLAARVGRWLFCHAGWFPDLAWTGFAQKAKRVLDAQDYGHPFLAESDSILMAKNWWKQAETRQLLVARLQREGLFGVVQGHQPQAYGIKGRIGAVEGGHLVKIDTGMAPSAGAHAGEILSIPVPSQLQGLVFPRMQAIAPDGSVREIFPERVADVEPIAAPR